MKIKMGMVEVDGVKYVDIQQLIALLYKAAHMNYSLDDVINALDHDRSYS